MPDVFAVLHAFGLGQGVQFCKACGREADGYSNAVCEFFDHQSLSRIKRPAAPRGSRQTPAIREREGKHGACRGENGGNPSRHTMEVHTTIAERDSHENLSEVRHVDQLRGDSRTTWHGPGSPIFSVHRVHLPSLLTCAVGANASPGSANRHAGWRGRSTKVPAITGFALGLFISGLDQLGPDCFPVIRAKLLQPEFGIDLVKVSGERWTCQTDALADLIEVLLIYLEQRGDFIPACWGVVWYCHGANSSTVLDLRKCPARFLLFFFG